MEVGHRVSLVICIQRSRRTVALAQDKLVLQQGVSSRKKRSPPVRQSARASL